MKYLAILLILAIQFSAHAQTTSKLSSVKWDQAKRSLILNQDTSIQIGVQAVCGYINNQALYASFGLEQQRFTCSKIVFPITVKHAKFFGHVDFAPLYDSIKSVTPSSILIYGQDAEGRDIQGNNPYFDWYKNLGTRTYYLGSTPLIEAYVGYQLTPRNSAIVGRMKVQTGLPDASTPWGDDGMFSPYSYWLSRDLMTGLRYIYLGSHFSAYGAVLSGNNPMKGYANYLNHIQSPNLKANNDVNFAAGINLHFGNPTLTTNLHLGALNDTMNSTWADPLQDGKRRNNVYAAGGKLSWKPATHWQIDLFSQYTIYQSGLTTDSNQNVDHNPLFKNINQSGYFAGFTIAHKAISFSYTYEQFDRFDYNVLYHWIKQQNEFSKGETLTNLESLQQSSNIINMNYQLNHFTRLGLNVMTINNPLEWVSSILDNRGDYRVSAQVLIDI